MGSRAWAGQGQQRPAIADGDVAKRSWWQFYREVLEKFDFLALSCDLTFKKTDHGAYNTFQVWGRIGANKYLLFQIRERLSFTEQLKKIEIVRQKYPKLNAVWIEDAANAEASLDVLKSKIPGLILIPADSSKLARAEAASPQIEAGNIFLPHPDICGLNDQGLPWVNDFIEEWAVVPNGKYWDQVDAAAMAILKLTKEKPFIYNFGSITKESTWLR
jgi:predicted phage terminase large subunit-like protein